MFKIGNRAIHQKNIKIAILEAKSNGFDVLEIHLTAPQFNIEKYSKTDLLKLGQFAKQKNIILQIHAPLEQSLIFTSLELREASKKYLKKVVGFGINLGARCITLHPGKAGIYHTTDDKKLKDDDIYNKTYSSLFENSIKHIVSIAKKEIFICIENTDNFSMHYQKVLDKYLPSGKVFLTWDIRKNYTYITNELVEEQWNFVCKNKNYVRNLHISGFCGVHGTLNDSEEKLMPFFELFSDKDIPMIIETLPFESAIDSKKIIESILGK